MGLRAALSRLLTVGGDGESRPTPWPETSKGVCQNCFIDDGRRILQLVITGEGIDGAVPVYFCDDCADDFLAHDERVTGVADTRAGREPGDVRFDPGDIDESLIGSGERPPAGKATAVEVDVGDES